MFACCSSFVLRRSQSRARLKTREKSLPYFFVIFGFAVENCAQQVKQFLPLPNGDYGIQKYFPTFPLLATSISFYRTTTLEFL